MRNTVSSHVSGSVVQVGNIHGDVTIHQYEYRPETSAPEVVAVVTKLEPGPTAFDGGFVGRGREVDRMLAALVPLTGTTVEGGRDGATAVPVRVSVVAGMGGVGKSALARHCALVAARRGWFPGGVFWVDLQGYSGEGAVASVSVLSPLLRQLGVPADLIPDLPADRAAFYDKTLRDLNAAGQAVLLVLDNASVSDQLLGLLPTSDRHRAVVTTRDTLDLPGSRRLPLDVLPTRDAITVLDRALRQQDDNDARVDADPAGTARLARVCGGLPLAMLIAAGLLADEPDLAPGILADQLIDAGTDGFAHGENQLAGVFTTSYQRLDSRRPEAARLLRLIAHAPGVDIDTAAAAALADISVDRARPLLRVLHHAHLLTTTVVDRWRMHDLVGRHTTDHLPHEDDGNDIEAALSRLLDHYLHSTLAADGHLGGLPKRAMSDMFSHRAHALAWLDIEHPNLVAAVRLATATGRHLHAFHLARALDDFLDWRRHVTDRLTVQRLALEAAHHLDNPRILADAWTYLGMALRTARHFEDAVTAHRTALDLYHDLGYRHGQGMALNNLGLALRDAGYFEQAVTTYKSALDLVRELGDRHGESLAWTNLGNALCNVRRFDDAVGAHRAALDIFRDLGNRHGEGTALNGLGLALREAGHLDKALAAHRAACDIHRDLGDRHGEGLALNNLGTVLREARRPEEAVTAYQTARDHFRGLGDRYAEGTAWKNLGFALLDLQRPAEALSSWNHALIAFETIGDTGSAATVQRLTNDLSTSMTTPSPPASSRRANTPAEDS